MTNEELVDRLTVESDLLPRMTEIYSVLFLIHDDMDMEEAVTLLQAAFWSGVEAAVSEEYADFREQVKSITRHSGIV